MNCEESANEVVDAIDMDDFEIRWSTTEKAVARIVVLVHNLKSRIIG